MKITTEKQIRENIRRQLLEAYGQAVEVLSEKKKEGNPDSVNFETEGIPGVPKKIEKLFDPDLSPQQFQKFNALADASTNINHQALAILGFAMDYSDNDVEEAVKMLVKARALAPKVKAAMEKSKDSKEQKGSEGEKSGEGKKDMSDFKWQS